MPEPDDEAIFKRPPVNQRRARAETDEDEERPRKKRPRDEDDEDEDRPLKKRSSRADDDDEEEDDDDGPRKKKPARADEESLTSGGAGKPMPLRLVGAILVAFLWGFFSLHDGCLRSSGSIFGIIQHHQMMRGLEEDMRRMQAFGFNQRIEVGARGELYALAGASLFRFVGAALLLAGGAMLLKRKALGKHLSLAGPGLMVLVELIGIVICLIISKGTILAHYNVDFVVNLVFSAASAGCIAYLLFNKEVGKVLR
jgi:hypothetical protein